MRHLTGTPYDLLKDKYDERTRSNPKHNRTLSDAIADLDRAFRSRHIRRNAKAKLESLRMGSNETFAEFYAVFQAQINKLDYHDDDKIDELKFRLNSRFASKILGRNDTYEQLVEYCYALDSELKMYDARRPASAFSKGNNDPLNPAKSKPRLDHATIELGKSTKPLSELSLDELKNYRNNLPRSAVIRQRLIDENRCHWCMQQGHTGLDKVCPFNRLPPSVKFKTNNGAFLNQTSIYEEGKDTA